MASPMIRDEGNLRWTFSWAQSALTSNCGASVLWGFGLSCIDVSKKADWGGYAGKPYAIETAFEFLDRHKKEILLNFKQGFYVLSDTIAYGRDFWADKENNRKDMSFLCTSRFAAWLASRKVGALFRGPITNNPRYGGTSNAAGDGHCICPWIWVPDVKCLKHAGTEFYIDPEWEGKKDTKKFGTHFLPAKARKYADNEKALSEGKIDLDGKEISPVARAA